MMDLNTNNAEILRDMLRELYDFMRKKDDCFGDWDAASGMCEACLVMLETGQPPYEYISEDGNSTEV